MFKIFFKVSLCNYLDNFLQIDFNKQSNQVIFIYFKGQSFVRKNNLKSADVNLGMEEVTMTRALTLLPIPK